MLAQQWVPGRREGVSLFIAGDEVLAACGHVAHRTTPPLGGASVVRESIEVPDDMLHAAVLLAKAIGLQGVCEVEFRRDAENRPLLMEINAQTRRDDRERGAGRRRFPADDLVLGDGARRDSRDRVPVLASGPAGSMATCDGYGRTGSVPGGPIGMSHFEMLYAFISEFAKSRHYDYFDRRDVKPFLAELRYTMHVLRKFNYFP